MRLPAPAESSLVVVGDVAVDGGQRSMLFATTKTGTLAAYDARTGQPLWQQSTKGPNTTFAAPVIDPSHAYVYSYGLDGFVHKYASATGTQSTSKPWPVKVTKIPNTEQGSSALTIAFGKLYVALSGYPGDDGFYVGHVVAIDLASGKVTLWNTVCAKETSLIDLNACGDNQGGIWARAGVVADPALGVVYVTTGNAPFGGATDWGDSVVALTPDLSRIVDSYTPANQGYLNVNDLELGSSNVALLPKISASRAPLMAVQGGKDGVLHLLNRQNLSGKGGPGHIGGELATANTPGSCPLFTQPTIWTDSSGALWIIVADDCGVAGYQIMLDHSGHPSLQQFWQVAQGGSSPAIGGGVIFLAANGNLSALDPRTGNQLWQTTAIGDIYGQSPIVVAGRVYVSDENAIVSIFGP
jgi:outer membrane protein assembly factor BamB